MKKYYLIGWVMSRVGNIPRTTDRLNWIDRMGFLMARLRIGRMNYAIDPCLYALGNPTPDSVVFVSANYKMSFDILRQSLVGIDAWILVLDTRGINVWCAAGKGTFGTAEIVKRVKLMELEKIVDHRKIVVPQLGAPGVSAHEVKKQTGFSVIYGPVRASDLPDFLEKNMQTTPKMREVKFTLLDRLVLVPAEIVIGLPYLFAAMLDFFLLSGLNRSGYSFDLALRHGLGAARNVVLIFLAGVLVAPVFLPWLPGRTFSVKGFFAGIIVFVLAFHYKLVSGSLIEVIAWLLLFIGTSSFLSMNFAGSSTYTSLSGVKKEMTFAVPLQIVAVVTGAVFWLIARFVY